MIDQIVRLTCNALGLGVASLLLLSSHLVAAEAGQVFKLGVDDKTFSEFNINNDPKSDINFVIGKNSLGDWPAYQPGSLDSSVRASTMQEDWVQRRGKETPSAPPRRTVVFDLGSPHGSFTVHLGLIFRYRRAATPKVLIEINGESAGTYFLNPRPAPELWWPNGGEGEGNLQYFGYEALNLTIPTPLFHKGRNTLGLKFVDGFGIYYDYLSLSNSSQEARSPSVSAEVQPTVLYKKRSSGLVELVNVRIRSTKALGRRKLRLRVGTAEIENRFVQDRLGDVLVPFEVPSIDNPAPARVYISGYSEPVWSGTFEPRRKWKVYALLMEQADFGYNDLPARTLEWENRFIDKTLKIQESYPSYSFTLDASANLESYLATRADEKSSRVLEHLRKGKWGINALYANFFTGLCSAEELFRSLDYGLRAGRDNGFPVDSASQTDEPSITWALPQILADAGIKYFTNGSDPIRGALNPIGLLNFHSPFYWESPTGSKVLVWSGVSYTAVDDITWAGWNEESVRQRKYSPSLFGITQSLPLFLSQYERDDFPFDAVLLFGLHNDEIPMRHWGDADVLEMWNKEYAYPKLVPGTQRDFFTHITHNFSDKIKTYRGDGGAYWEDEAGADARIAAMIRASQNQIVAAEKFESVAHWLTPDLKFDKQPFQFTWKNILLADSYVWSDANSLRRPYSYRTLGGESAHRAWGEAAYQTSSDLRLVAMDKIAELVSASQPGAVVFNSESWARSDLFDFELELDETLIDPATGQAIPCGAIKQSFGYQQVRCWANEVPAVGYKFYAVAKGTVSEGKPVHLDPRTPSIENDHYRLQLSPDTGAVVHLIDKKSNLELVKSDSPYKLDEYLYVTGGDPGSFSPGSLKDNRILAADVTLPLPELQVHEPTVTQASTAVRYPWGTLITVHSKSTNTPEITSTITLVDREKRVLFDHTVQKEDTLKKEGVYFSFPFALSAARMMYQGATAWVDPEGDMLPGANRQWFATQGGVWGEGSNTNIAWATREAPLVTLRDINRGLWPESMKVNGTVFSYAMNNYWYTDTPSHQGGRFNFHYALTSGKDVNPADAFCLSAEQRNPLVAIRHYNMGWDQTLPTSGTGFLSASPRGVAIIGVTPADKAGSFLIRLQNFTPDTVMSRVDIPHMRIEDAYLGSVLGEHAGKVEWNANSLTVPLKRYEIKTIAVTIQGLSSRLE
jgi:alpha-mannosidase